MSSGVREYPAPSGALRQALDGLDVGQAHHVRGHPAPSGALRPHRSVSHASRKTPCQGAPSTIRCIETGRMCGTRSVRRRCQGAPSTIRCIKTATPRLPVPGGPLVREHPAPSGALRRPRRRAHRAPLPVREYPAPSGAFAPLPQKSRSWSSAQVPGVRADRCCGGAACGCGISISPVSLCSVVRTQGRNQAVVCGVVLRNSVPCVRNRELRAKGAPSAIGCIEAGP